MRVPSMASLRLFIQVAHNLSFSETARSANVSQPALSRTIRLLEESLGVRLFDRDSRNVSLTSAGEALLPVVERLAADFDHAFTSLAQTFAGEQGRVVVGALPSVAAVSLPKIIALFKQAHPHVEIVLRDDLSGSLYQQIQDRQIDLAITTPPGSAGFDFISLMKDQYGLVCRAGGVLDEPGPAAWSVFADNPFLAMAARSSVRQMTDRAQIMAGIVARPLYECAHLATMGALLTAGLGVTALPRSTLRMLGQEALVWRTLENPTVHREIGIARLSDRTLPPAANLFAEHFIARWHALLDPTSES